MLSIFKKIQEMIENFNRQLEFTINNQVESILELKNGITEMKNSLGD